MSDFSYPSTKPKASKDYQCIACLHLRDAWNDADINQLPKDELDAYNLAKEHGFKILKGETYVCQSGFYDGNSYTFRGIPAINDICHKYDLYPQD